MTYENNRAWAVEWLRDHVGDLRLAARVLRESPWGEKLAATAAEIDKAADEGTLALAALEAPQPATTDFCDGHCTWRDHAPGCPRHEGQQSAAVDEAVVEAVARAICVACEENPDHQGDARGNESRWQDYRNPALAAISAIAARQQGGA